MNSETNVNKPGLMVTVVGLLVLSFAAGGFVVWSLGWGRSSGSLKPTPPGQGTAEPVRPPAQVVALGRLEPEGGVINLGSSLPDRLEKLFVKEGDEVKPEQELAYLESHDERVADRNLTSAQLDEARKRLVAITESGENQVREAEIQLALVEKVEPLEIAAQEARVRLLRETRGSAKVELERLQGLKIGSVPQQQIDLQAVSLKKAEEELSAVTSLLDKLKSAHQNNIEAAQAKVASAKSTLVRYQAEIPVESLKKTLALAEVRVKHTVLRAPSAGKILKIQAHPGETLGTRPVLQLADTRQIIAIAEVYETDVQYVKKGQRAELSSRALPDKLTGTVTHVGSLVARNRNLDYDPTAAADRRVVEVTIKLDPSKTATDYINMQVRVTIQVQ